MNNQASQNPEYQTIIIPHAIYATHKNTRMQIQTQRQQVQHTISQLERQAKKSARELEKKKKTLLSYYKLKASRFQQSLKNEQLRKKRMEELQRQRQMNTSMRQNSRAAKTINAEKLFKRKNQSFNQLKRERSVYERKLSQQKELQIQLLRRRNSAFSKAATLGTEYARAKSFLQKRAQTSQVKKDLIQVQQTIKSRQIYTIDHLNMRQKELLNTVQRNIKQKQQYDSTLKRFQSTPFDQIYPVIKAQTSPQRVGKKESSFKNQLFYPL